ncbi:MAG: energy-coupling factor transporter transmembrane component T [bacterium]
MATGKRIQRAAADPAWQYVPGRSFVHRAPPLLKAGAASAAFLVFLRMSRPEVLAGALLCVGAAYLAAGLGVSRLWRDMRYVLLQALIVSAVIGLAVRTQEGVRLGAVVGLKLLVFTLPAALWLRTTLVSDLLYASRRLVPYRYLFLVGVTIRFVPYLIQDFRDIVEAQRLRGVSLSLRSLVSPAGWRDVAHCLLVPMIVRVVKTSEEIRLSAVSRGLESADTRTYLKDA